MYVQHTAWEQARRQEVNASIINIIYWRIAIHRRLGIALLALTYSRSTLIIVYFRQAKLTLVLTHINCLRVVKQSTSFSPAKRIEGNPKPGLYKYICSTISTKLGAWITHLLVPLIARGPPRYNWQAAATRKAVFILLLMQSVAFYVVAFEEWRELAALSELVVFALRVRLRVCLEFVASLLVQ